jgi:hypothetical protein
MLDASFSNFSTVLHSSGPATAVEQLIAELRQSEDYHSLFYALLMKARVALGVSPFPTGPSADLPANTHDAYEEGIRAAAREVGSLHLAKNDLPRAWGFYRLIGELQPVKDALDKLQPGPDEDIYPLLDIAWHQRVHPNRGFDLLLERLGVCSAITTLSSTDLSNDIPLRIECVRKLIAALHSQLKERLAFDLSNRGIPIPETIPQMLRDELFTDDAYHIDVSHLASVAQMSLELPPGDPSLPAARDLCDYGRRLAPGFRGRGEAPFDDQYADFSVYLAILAGEDIENGLRHFEAKIEPELAEGNTFPAEVFINLLVRLDRKPAALAAAQRYLINLSSDTSLSCPDVIELARQVGDYAALAEAARVKGDAVTFLASLIAARQSG